MRAKDLATQTGRLQERVRPGRTFFDQAQSWPLSLRGRWLGPSATAGVRAGVQRSEDRAVNQLFAIHDGARRGPRRENLGHGSAGLPALSRSVDFATVTEARHW